MEENKNPKCSSKFISKKTACDATKWILIGILSAVISTCVSIAITDAHIENKETELAEKQYRRGLYLNLIELANYCDAIIKCHINKDSSNEVCQNNSYATRSMIESNIKNTFEFTRKNLKKNDKAQYIKQNLKNRIKTSLQYVENSEIDYVDKKSKEFRTLAKEVCPENCE